MPDHARKIFISYRRSDAVAMASRIYQAMAAQFGPKRVFRDTEDMPVGVRFPDYLQKTLLQCTVAFVLIGPDWLRASNPDGTRRLDDPSDFVRLEVETALSHGSLVCPLLVDGASMPTVEDLPPSLQEVHWRNALPIHSSDAEFAQDIKRLAGDIKAAVEGRGGTLVERFAIAGRTTAIPLTVGAAVGAAAVQSGGIGSFLQQVWSTVAAKVVAAVVAVAVVTAVVVTIAHPAPPSAPVVTTFPVPTTNSEPDSITSGPDGNLWFIEDGNKIGRITPSGSITEFPLPALTYDPLGITSGPDGNLWFTEYYANNIGRITP